MVFFDGSFFSIPNFNQCGFSFVSSFSKLEQLGILVHPVSNNFEGRLVFMARLLIEFGLIRGLGCRTSNLVDSVIVIKFEFCPTNSSGYCSPVIYSRAPVPFSVSLSSLCLVGKRAF
jgi:hypothetical protein